MLSFILTALVLGGHPLLAQENPTDLAPVRVFGADRSMLSESSAPGVVSKDVIKSQQITDVNRALRQTTGVSVREEDGQGLRPNISLRGTNPDRSKKVTLLEDGILIGPAPYSAPAAYYTPGMNHIESLKVYKGFAATGIGPNSIGGAIDYRTLNIPSEMTAQWKSTYGSFNTWNNVLLHGGTFDFGSYLVSGSYWSSDGFKELDGGGNTGFEKADVFTKFRVNLPRSGDKIHSLEARVGYATEDSRETYLGLAASDFDENPYRRYRGSSEDEMMWTYSQFQLRHELQLDENALLENVVYRHNFKRDWHRLERFGDGTRPTDVLRDPTIPANNLKYNILKGEQDSGGAAGQLILAGNERTYLSQGVQSRLSTSFSSNAIETKPWVLGRVHQDEIKRNHTANAYEMLDGRMVRTADPSAQEALNKEAATALTGAAGADVKISSLTVTPIIRYESIRFEYLNDLNSTTNKERKADIFLPGLSLLHEVSERWSARLSWNEASTVAGLSADGSEVREKAQNYEAELRYINPDRQIEGQAVFFYMDYQNLTGTCSASNGCQSSQIGTAFDGGEAVVKGVELVGAKGFQWGEFFIPIQGNITLLQAEFRSGFISQSAEWGTGTIQKGDPLPYIPEIQYSLTFGMEWKRFRQDLTFFYQSKVYDQSAEANRREIEAFGVVDWAGRYDLSKRAHLLFKADNILARKYAVAAHPFGLRPGKPQAFQAGFSYEF